MLRDGLGTFERLPAGMTQKLILSVFANNVSDHLAKDHPHFVEREGP